MGQYESQIQAWAVTELWAGTGTGTAELCDEVNKNAMELPLWKSPSHSVPPIYF